MMADRVPTFQYCHLEDGHIRLLFLTLAPETPDSYEYALKTFPLDQAPPFYALSYTWGKHPPWAFVPCKSEDDGSGGDIRVPPSLDRALPYLAAAGHSPLWTDSICFNQLDEPEVAKFVPMMHEYYTNAKQVVCWLGEDGDGSDLAMDVISYLADPSVLSGIDHRDETGQLIVTSSQVVSLRTVIENNIHIYNAKETLPELNLPGVESLLWSALRSFYTRDYFSRVWVMQEILLARTAIVQIGHRIMPWPKLRDIGRDLAGLQLMWIGVTVPAWCLLEELAWSASETAFMSFLDAARDRFTKYADDRVYGLLALAPKNIRQGIVVKYNFDDEKNWVKVYKESTAILLDNNPLDCVLAAAKSDNKDPLLPSWCPDWRLPLVSRQRPPIVHFGFDFAELDKKYLENGSILHSRGAHLDTVAKVSSEFPIHWPPDPSGENGPAHVKLKWIEECHDLVTSVTQGGSDTLSELCKILIAETPGIPKTGPRFPEDPRKALEGYNVRMAEWRDCAPGTRPTTPLVEGVPLFANKLSQLWGSKVMFTTEGGRVGFANRGTQPGDMLCVLFGGLDVHVLRAVGEFDYVHHSVAFVRGCVTSQDGARLIDEGLAKDFRIV